MDTGDLIKRIKNRDISRRDLLKGMSAAGLAVVMTPAPKREAQCSGQRLTTAWSG